MSISIIPPALHTSSRAAPLLVALLLGACDLREPIAPQGVEVPPVNPSEVVTHLVFDVDPQTGAVVQRAQAAAGTGGPTRDLLPVGSDLVRASVTCQGCGDQQLGWEILTVRFTVIDASLESYWVDFRRDETGQALPVMNCSNCDVRWAAVTPLPVGLQAGEVFEAVVGVLSQELRPFSIGFDLVAGEIQMPTRVLELQPPGATLSSGTAVNNRGEVLVASDAGSFIWSATAGFRAIPGGDWQAMNDNGEVVGTRGSFPASSESGDVHIGPSRMNVVSIAINNHGLVVGELSHAQADMLYEWGPVIPFHWRPGREIEPLELPEGLAAGVAVDVNDHGHIAGTAYGTYPIVGTYPISSAVLWVPTAPVEPPL